MISIILATMNDTIHKYVCIGVFFYREPADGIFQTARLYFLVIVHLKCQTFRRRHGRSPNNTLVHLLSLFALELELNTNYLRAL